MNIVWCSNLDWCEECRHANDELRQLYIAMGSVPAFECNGLDVASMKDVSIPQEARCRVKLLGHNVHVQHNVWDLDGDGEGHSPRSSTRGECRSVALHALDMLQRSHSMPYVPVVNRSSGKCGGATYGRKKCPLSLPCVALHLG